MVHSEWFNHWHRDSDTTIITPTQLYEREWRDAPVPRKLDHEVSHPWTSKQGHTLVAIKCDGKIYVIARRGDDITNCWEVTNG